jgi:hypothetical protein
MDKQTYLDSLKKEIETDPSGRGYDGKTPKEIAILINSPIVTKTDVLQPAPVAEPKTGDKIGENVVVKDPRVFNVIMGIPDAPNIVSVDDINEVIK